MTTLFVIHNEVYVPGSVSCARTLGLVSKDGKYDYANVESEIAIPLTYDSDGVFVGDILKTV